MKLTLTLLTLLAYLYSFSQTNLKLLQVASENVYIASTVDAYNPLVSNKKDRVIREVLLPPNTVAYTFRVTVTESQSNPNNSLINDITELGAASFPTTSMLLNLATSSDGNYADVYIFDDMVSARKFENKAEGWWGCKAYKQTMSTCRSSDECLNMVAVGFRNNNSVGRLNIYFELVAVVDNSRGVYSKGMYDTLYNSCIRQTSVQEKLKERAQEFCSCMADKLSQDSTFMLASNPQARELSSKTLTYKCLEELRIASKTELSENNFLEEIKSIESTSGRSGVIRFCEEKINEGNVTDLAYNTLGWYCLLTKQYTKACYYLKTASEKFPINLYLQGNYAHALLLTGRIEEAFTIYKRYINENVDESLSWKQAVIQDISQFKSLGIVNDKFEEVLQFMK